MYFSEAWYARAEKEGPYKTLGISYLATHLGQKLIYHLCLKTELVHSWAYIQKKKQKNII